MAHPLVDQLRFARSEFMRGLGEVADPQAQQRFGNMNCISWIIGHLAWQEQRYWLQRAQDKVLIPGLNERLAYGKPACTPPAEEMWAAWKQVTAAADPWLDGLTTEKLQEPLTKGFSNNGTFLQRVIYHYWYHLGEGMAIRQMLGHTGLPDFVGDIDELAPYRPESGEPGRQPFKKDEFIQTIQEVRAKFDELLEQIRDEQMDLPGASGEWTMKDVLAHITWHEREMVGVLRSRALVGSELWNLPLDERNQVIYQENRDLPLGQVRAEAQEIHRQLIQELGGLTDEDLIDPSRFADFPPDWVPWKLMAENTYWHYLDHIPAIQDWLNKTTAQG